MKKLKIMSAILAVIMTFGLCACGKDGGNSPSDAPTTSATTVAPSDTATTTAAAADEFITTGKSVKITIPKLENTVKIDKAKFGVIKDITDKGFYTNSYHVDVREKIDAFDKLAFEAEFQSISTGGCISYIEIPNMTKNLTALRQLITFMYENISYSEWNTKSDYCHKCGFDEEIVLNDNLEWECPQCGNKDKNHLTVVRRTCGYLGSEFWNEGRTKDIQARVTHL